MKTIILFPCSPFNKKEVEEQFRYEYNCAKAMFQVELFDYDKFLERNFYIDEYIKMFTEPTSVIYRGWMLNKIQYIKLYNELKSKNLFLINDSEQYLNCHYFPNSYEHIKQYAQPISYTKDLSIQGIDSARCKIVDDVILKDFVKSEKGNDRLFYLPITLTDYELKSIVDEFVIERGNLFNEGICFKQVIHDLLKYEDSIVEYRIFYFNGKVLLMDLNINIIDNSKEIPIPTLEFCDLIGKNLYDKSNFFTIDIAYSTTDKKWIILETGDGQVSGLAAQCNPMIFYYHLADILS